MKLSDLLEIIWSNMWRRRARTILTMIGVIIGSVAIFVIVSIGNGFQAYVGNQFSSLGDANVITVIPYNSYGQQIAPSSTKKKKLILNDKSLNELKKINGVKYCVPIINLQGSIKYKKNQLQSNLMGMEMKEYSKDHKLFAGRFPSDEGQECVIGYKLAKYIIGGNNSDSVTDSQIKDLLRKRVQIVVSKISDTGDQQDMEYSFKISGISLEGSSDDFMVKIPLKAAKTINQSTTNGSEQSNSTYGQINVVVNDVRNINQIEKSINSLGYTASSLKEILDAANTTLNGVKLVVGALGAISLLVSAFGIANTMNMSIYERKKEIGVMKVIGAGLFDIKKIFIGEASAIGFMGGLIGVILGFLINFIVNSVLRGYLSSGSSGGNVKIATASVGLVLFVLLFSLFIGFLSGIYPASKASKLNVIKSIKDE